MAVTTRPPVGSDALRVPEVAAAENRTPPVVMWAVLGAAILVFVAYVLTDWVTGPYFETVPDGPSDPPTWMQIELIAWQVASIPAALGVIYWFVVRPWRRERHIGVDGMLVIGFSTMWFQDPLSSAGNHWFVYNTEMLNYGSWVHSVPWFTAFGEPGAMTSEPILFTPAAYVYIMIIAAALGCWVMRKAKQRWPQISTGRLVVVCFTAMCVFDIVLEGLIWLPLGVFEYPGGHWSIFSDSYHKYPLNEMFTIGAVFTAISCLRFFTNDKGQMWVERGAEQVRGGNGKKMLVRALAVTAAIHTIMFLGYNIPNTAIGLNSTEWPRSLQQKSYFTNYICGAGTDRLCPGPGVSNQRDGSAYVGADGKVVIRKPTDEPPGRPLPGIVPFDPGKPSPDE